MSDDFSDNELDVDTDSFKNNLEKKFNTAANYIQSVHSNLTQNQLLEIYGLYKLSTIGKCNIEKPGGIFNLQAKAKWKSWSSLGEMNKCEAMQKYIDKVVECGWNEHSDNKNQSWVCHSVYLPIEEENVVENNKTAFDYCKENNIEKLKSIIKHDSINNLDASGLGLIHWATDRNATEILEYLITCGANINLQDKEKQTALHYASSCGHSDCINILIKFGADKTIKDNDRQTCLDVAFDESMKLLLEK